VILPRCEAGSVYHGCIRRHQSTTHKPHNGQFERAMNTASSINGRDDFGLEHDNHVTAHHSVTRASVSGHRTDRRPGRRGYGSHEAFLLVWRDRTLPPEGVTN
jgi:hypothetical protein